MAYTEITGNNTKFKVNVQWTFTTAAATRTNLAIQPVNNSALTFQSAVTLPTTGTFTLVNIRGMRTDSSVSYQNSSTKMNIGLGGRWNNAWSGNASNAGWIGFNKNSSSWGSANTWSAKNINTFGGNNVQSVATSKSFNLQTYSSSQAVINKWFNTNLNCGVTATRTYSKDNTNWQSSATFTGLTPNTNYTLYMKTVTTTGSGNSATNYDHVTLTTPSEEPKDLQLSLLNSTTLKNYHFYTRAIGATNSNVHQMYITARPKGEIEWTHREDPSGASEGTVDFTFSEDTPVIECCIQANNPNGRTYIMSIPEEYQQVEYIETSGTQYIDSGFIFGNNSRVDCCCSLVGTPTAQDRIFGKVEGSGTGSGSTGFSAGMYISGGANVMSWWCSDGTGVYHNTSMRWNNLKMVFSLDSANGIWDMGGCTNGSITDQHINDGTRSMYIGCENGYGTARNFASARYYWVCFSEGDVPKVLLIPCYRKSDGVIGMYDPIQKEFHTNAGSGTFTKGGNTYTASTTFWANNPRVWVNDGGTWKKRKYIYKKGSSSWSKIGDSASRSDIGMGAKITASMSGYTPLDYIQSDSYTNYFTIPKTANTEVGFKIKASISERYRNTYSPLIISTGITDRTLWFQPAEDVTHFNFYGFDATHNWTATINQPFTVTFKPEKCYCEINDNGTVIGNVTYKKGNYAPTATSIMIMNYPTDPSGQYGFKGKLYYCILYEDGRVAHYLVPAKNSSNVVGLYDIKTNTFYTNGGTGTLTAGTTRANTEYWWEALDMP